MTRFDVEADVRGGMIVATLIMISCTVGGILLASLLLWWRWS